MNRTAAWKQVKHRPANGKLARLVNLLGGLITGIVQSFAKITDDQ